jgi:hypothetical protein
MDLKTENNSKDEFYEILVKIKKNQFLMMYKSNFNKPSGLTIIASMLRACSEM